MQRNLILMRDVTQPLDNSDELRGGFTHVHRGTDPGASELEAFCTSHRFPPQWVAKMLGLGAQAWLLIQDGQPIATGWLVREPFFIEEIGRTFDPRPDGDYYFGDFVAPAFRGNRLQRALICQRLAASRAAGRRWATALARDNNPASLRNYEREAFVPAAELITRSGCGLRLDRLRRLDFALPLSNFSPMGVSLPFSFYLGSVSNR
jgi:GNAT superfamily N-acetyltransferase